MKKLLIAICVCVSGCFNTTNIIKDDNIVKVSVIKIGQDSLPHVFTSNDSITTIVSSLNKGTPEPIKFMAVYKIEIGYRDGSSVIILGNGSSIKVDGRTFKIQENLNQLIPI